MDKHLPSGLVPADSPDRCQRTIPSGQCQNRAIPGTTFCEKHTSRLTRLKHAHRQYEIDDARLRLQLDKFAQSDAIYSMKEEIAILRQFIESLMRPLTLDDSPESRAQQAITIPAIVNLLEALDRLVKTSGNMEIKFAHLLTKDTVYRLATRIVEILSEEISHVEGYEAIVDTVTARIADEIDSAKNEEQDDQ